MATEPSLVATSERLESRPNAFPGHPDAGFLRGTAANASRSGVQKRIDKLVRERFERDKTIAQLQQRNTELENLLSRWKAIAAKYKQVLTKKGNQHGE